MGLPRNNLFWCPRARQCSGCGRRGASGTRGATPPPPPTTSRVSHDLRCFHSCNWGHGLGSYSQCSVLPTDYGHTMAKFPMPNKYFGFGYKGLVFCRSNGWLMENKKKKPTVPKSVLINRTKIPQMLQKISAQFVCPSPKVWDFRKKSSLGVRSPSLMLMNPLAFITRP